jgi:hypothetical protein
MLSNVSFNNVTLATLLRYKKQLKYKSFLTPTEQLFFEYISKAIEQRKEVARNNYNR